MAILTVGVGYTYATIQAAIDAASGGDTITCKAGQLFTETLEPPDKGALGSYITITTDASPANLPVPGQRTSPAYAAFMPRIQSPGSGAPAVQFLAGANHYKFQHVEFLEVPEGRNTIIAIGYGDSTQQFESQEPHDIIIDQCYIHGGVVCGQKRAIDLAGKTIAITNNCIRDIKAVGQDAQCVAGWNGHGPYVITNNDLNGGTEPYLFGGSDPSIRTYTTVTGSPTTTSAAVTCTESGHTVAEFGAGQRIAVLVGGVWRQTTISTVTGTGVSGTLTFAALPGVPDVPGWIKGGCQAKGILIRSNHIWNDPTWRLGVLGSAATISSLASTASGSLAAGTYYYTVQAFNTAGYEGQTVNGAVSSETFKTLGATGTITITYDAVTNAESYRVWRGTSPGGQTQWIASASSPFVDDGTGSWTTATPGGATKFAIKNLGEIKAAEDVQDDSNIYEYCWKGSDVGYAFWGKTVNQDGGAPFLKSQKIVKEKNVYRHIFGFAELHGIEAEHGGPPGALTDVTIRNNVVYDCGTEPWAEGNQTFAIFASEGGVNWTFDHNTIDMVTTGAAGGAIQLDDTVALLSGFRVTNNILRGGFYGIICSGGQGTAGLQAAAPGYVFSRNVLSNVPAGSYPANNFYPTDAALDAAFTTYAVNGVGANFTLLPSSPYKIAGTDGKDLGADIDLVMRATATAISGASTIGTGKIRIRRATTTGAVSVLSASDIVYRGALRMPNASIDTTSTYGGMSGRIVGGQTHVFLYDSISATSPPNVWELDITGLTPQLDYTQAPRASVVRNWGQIYGAARASWTPSGALKDGFAANYNKIGHVNLHWHEGLQQLYWSYVDFYNVNGDPDWTMGFSILNSDGTSTGYGPFRLKATDRDGNTWYGHRSYFFFEHPTTGKLLSCGIAHSGDASVSFGPACYGDADWPTPATPGGHNAANDITLPSRYLDYYCMNGAFAQSTGNYFNLDGSWNGVIRAFQFDGVLTYPVEYFPTDYTQARVDPSKNGGKGTWQGAMCSMQDAFWFEGTHKRGVLYVGVLAAGYSTDPTNPNASHTWYRNVALGHDRCMHGFSCVQCASAGDSSTKTIPAFIVFDPDRLNSNKIGATRDYETAAAHIIDAELTYGIRTCSQDKLQAKSLGGVWRVPGSTRFLVSANTADISRAGESFPETLLHVFDIND